MQISVSQKPEQKNDDFFPCSALEITANVADAKYHGLIADC